MNGPHQRTPARLEPGMVVTLIPGAPVETVDHVELVKGRWIVRTDRNLHRCPSSLLITVVEVPAGVEVAA